MSSPTATHEPETLDDPRDRRIMDAESLEELEALWPADLPELPEETLARFLSDLFQSSPYVACRFVGNAMTESGNHHLASLFDLTVTHAVGSGRVVDMNRTFESLMTLYVGNTCYNAQQEALMGG